jgi:serine/threonine protein kinase
MKFAGFFDLFQRRPAPTGPQRVHLTNISRSAASSITRTGQFLKRRIWLFPVIAVVVLALIGWGMRRAIETTMKENLKSELETLLNVETAMLDTWIRVQLSNAESEANAVETRELFQKLQTEFDSSGPAKGSLKTSELQKDLRKLLTQVMSAHGYHGYIVVDKSMVILGAYTDELIGSPAPKQFEPFITQALKGESTVCPPYSSLVMLKDEFGQLRSGVPTMFVCAPIRDANFQVIGAIGLRIRPELEFTRILQLGRIGTSGETYAFNASGTMVSNSRFDEDLMLLGLIPDSEYSRSILNLQLRDPGGNLKSGFRPKQRRSSLPQIKMVEQATRGISGVDVEGFNDYRGVPVIGAWHWYDKYGFGIATQMDFDEAYRTLTILKRTFWGLFALLGLSSIAIFVFTLILAQMQREAQKQAIASQKLGQYRLEEKLGSGGMGVVYKGVHAILRRPTAIKLLHVEKVNDSSIERFEREVQITCQLNNPNTVAIYDYGRTEEGLFYYAMEYLDGIDLQNLVEKYGPQSEARVIHILEQICGSLYEAHSLGLVHRDIKPANIMLNRRGGEPDVVKVLDFGLVKALDDDKQANLTAANSMTGTPLYMSPESIQTPNSVDGRSDLYAVGAVGYFLLTGHPVFETNSIVELCQQHVSAVPIPPTERLGAPVSKELEAVLLACLEKSRAKRPQTARDLASMLAKCPTANRWSVDEADAWWGRHERGVVSSSSTSNSLSGSSKSTSQQHERTFVTDVE